MINITLPDGSVRQYEAGTTALGVAKSIELAAIDSTVRIRSDFFIVTSLQYYI